MNKLVKLFTIFISAITLTIASISSSFAKVEGEYIVLGSAISLTGKYSSNGVHTQNGCLLYTSPSPRDRTRSRMPSSA